MNNALTSLQAFYSMEKFLEGYFRQTGSDALGALLSCMQFLDDGRTADPAIWEKWVTSLNAREYITPLQAFEAMCIFLNDYYRNESSSIIKKFIANLTSVDTGGNKNQNLQTAWHNWMQCVDYVLYKNDE